MPRTFKTRNIPCTFTGCGREFTNRAGLTNHQRIHKKPSLTRVQQPAARLKTPSPSRSPSPDWLGPDYDAGMHAPAEEGPAPFPQPRKRETIIYHPFINGIVL